MGWSVGYLQDDGEETHFANFATFGKGMAHLEGHVLTVLDNMEESDNLRKEYETVFADIKDISRDPGIMDDPDQWEDLEFYTESGYFYIVEY